jgi:ferredoxin
MKVVVDRELCESNALCTGIAPDIFALDSDDIVVLLVEEPDEDRREAVERAVDSCPKRALRLE